MPLEKKKHPYQHEKPVEVYDRTHNTPPHITTDISNFIIELAKEFKNGSEKINILDAGIGDGSVIAIPLISKAIENEIALNIIGFDNSSEMLNRLYQKLKETFCLSNIAKNNDGTPLFLEAKFNEKVYLKVYMADIENEKSFK